MERNEMNKNAEFAIKKDAFIAALNEVNVFLPPTKVLEGSNIVSLEINSGEECLVFTGLGVDNSLISREIECKGVEGNVQIYFDGPSTLAKVNKLEKDLTFKFSSELRKLYVVTESSVITINAFSELDFDEDGKVIENTESTYQIPDAPIRSVLGRQIGDIGDFGSFEVALKPFGVGIKSVSTTPFKGGEQNSEIIKLCAIPSRNELTISGSDGLVIGMSKITDCKIDNPLNEKEIGFSLKKEMVEKLSKSIDAIISGLAKINKSSNKDGDHKIKVSLGKAMISMEVAGTKISMRKYNEMVPDISEVFDVPYTWYGIVNVSKLKNAIDITKGATKSGISSEFGEDECFEIDLKNKKLKLSLSSSVGEGGASLVDYEQLEGVPYYEESLSATQIYVPYSKIYAALSLMIDSQSFVRVHEKAPGSGIGMLSFVNADSHSEYGFAHGLMVNLK